MRPSPTADLSSFRLQFEEIMGTAPLPWQDELYLRFCRAAPPRRLPLPTGLGKTAVMVIWFLALKAGAPVPRRLVYVVDRRAVVDQATTLALALKEYEGGGLAVSTLRGRHVDNREWLEHPAVPAVIVGTVDMIGSRLLFSGYGVSTGMRPCHAGLLGADTLLVLDEAHLCPAFEALLTAVASRDASGLGAAPGNGAAGLVPPFRLLVMSATLGDAAEPKAEDVLRLDAADRSHPVVRQRLTAAKQLRLEAPAAQLAPALAKAALQQVATAPDARVVVFCHGRDTALKVKDAIAKSRVVAEDRLGLLVGARRVREREALAGWLEATGFTAAPSGGAVLVATAAGEVGVDLDADHMVCDLVAWERMAQRLGRVNRRGGAGRVSRITVIPDKTLDDRLAAPVLRLPTAGEARDASLAALEALAADPEGEAAMRAATTPAPLYPPLDRALVEAWSLTSLPDAPGRPDVAPWLRGWETDDDPSATVVWRSRLPLWQGKPIAPAEEDRFLDVARPHLSEGLEAPLWEITRVLAARAESAGLPDDHVAAFVLRGGKVQDRATVATLRLLTDKRVRDRLVAAGVTLLVDARLGGLTTDGMLDGAASGPALTLDGGGDADWAETVGLLVTDQDGIPDARIWRRAQTVALAAAEETGGDASEALVLWVARATRAERRGDPAIARAPQTLADHAAMAAEAAEEIAAALVLPPEYAQMLRLAAHAHDDGKDCDRWQTAMNAPRDGRPYAKTGGTGGGRGLDGYRHEFGSLGRLLADERLEGLPADLRDLALHLVTAHHGHARPTIAPLDDSAPPDANRRRAREAALRFARLQRLWGPWGLAWWEAVLRAADRLASARFDAEGD